MVVFPMVAIMLLTGTQPAAACSCSVPSDREAFDRADAVFTATLERIDSPQSGRSTAPRVFTFAVDSVFKGEVAPTQTVRSEQSSASCGIELAGAGPYLVFALGELGRDHDIELGRGELYTGLCGGSRSLAVGGPLDPSLAASPYAPDPNVIVEPPDDGSSTSDVVLRVVLFVIFLVVGMVGVWAVFLDRSPRLAPPDSVPPRPRDEGQP